MFYYYALNDDKSVRPLADGDDYREAFRKDNTRVAETYLGAVYVSTVFLGMNHGWADGPPMIFETMVFPSVSDLSEQLCWRYSTWNDAAAGHAKAVELVERYLAESRSLEDLGEEDQPPASVDMLPKGEDPQGLSAKQA